MRRTSFFLFASLVSSLLACGDDTDGPGGAGGAGTTASSSSSGPSTTGSSSSTSASSSSSSAATTAASSVASTGAGGSDCPDIVCTQTCDHGYWDDLEGCQTCACAPPPVELATNGTMHDSQDVAFQTMADHFIGGIDRWVFNFQWSYDDPQASDDEIVVEATVRIMQLGPMYEPNETNVTWFEPEHAGMPLEVMQGDYTLYGFGIVMDTLTPVSGYLSIRRVGDVFEGGVSLEMQGAGAAGAVHASGPFSVPVP